MLRDGTYSTIPPINARRTSRVGRVHGSGTLPHPGVNLARARREGRLVNTGAAHVICPSTRPFRARRASSSRTVTRPAPGSGRTDGPPPRATWLTPRSPSQEYCTRAGVWWRVYEVAQRHVGPVVEPRSLVFESMTVMRRVCAFPNNWASLDGSALEQLSLER